MDFVIVQSLQHCIKYILNSPREFRKEEVMIILCNQLVEALDYMHREAKVLHNDLKCDNIFVCDRITEASRKSSDDSSVQLMFVDFGKATSVEKGRLFHLNGVEKSDYALKFPHIAPEVVDGFMKQTVMSDMYPAGYVFRKSL